MRIAAAILGLVGLMATSQAAAACDLEGFGFTRMNPFAQHAAWGAQADASARSQDQAADTSQEAARAQQSQPTSKDAEAPRDSRQSLASQGFTPQNFTPVSAEAAASQAQRFTATKD